MEKIKELFHQIDEIDKDIDSKIKQKRMIFEKIKQEFDSKIVPEIKKQLGVKVICDVFQNVENPADINLTIFVCDERVSPNSLDEKYEKEDLLLNKVYSILDKMLSKEIANKVSVIPVLGNC